MGALAGAGGPGRSGIRHRNIASAMNKWLTEAGFRLAAILLGAAVGIMIGAVIAYFMGH